jgi:hypothetical protein
MNAPKPMTATALGRLMAREWTPPAGANEAEEADGSPIDPAVARVLLIYREAVAEASCQAYLALDAIGIDNPTAYLLGWRQTSRGWRPAGGS